MIVGMSFNPANFIEEIAVVCAVYEKSEPIVEMNHRERKGRWSAFCAQN